MTEISLSSADRPASARKAVVFSCDGNYMPFALAAAQQIAELHPNRDFDICLCSEDLPELPPGFEHLGLRRIAVSTGGHFAGLRLDARRTEAVYMRLALPLIFADEYDRLLYLDADIFVQRGDFSALLDVDMKGHVVAAVRDHIQWRTPNRKQEQYRRFGWPAGPYFNSGVLLIDVPAFEAREMRDRCVAFGLEHKDNLIGHDQTLLNCVLRADWAELSPMWNWQDTRSTRLFGMMEGAHLLHFIGPAKPWNTNDGRFPLPLWQHFDRFMARHYPERHTPTAPAGPLANREFMGKMLMKHFVSQSSTRRYLSRFESALDVISPAGAR